MRKFAIGKAVPDDGKTSSSAEGGSSGAWFREHWRLLSLFVIIIAAFLMRFVFAYGISAGDNYALSGGSSATNNLRIVEEILAGTYSPARDAALNYPFGSVNTFGPLFDYIIAAFAFVATFFGVSDATAAAGVLAWSAPVLGALTCIPVYMTAKKMFKGDEVIGIAAALFYAFFALLIMTTPFSNGTGFAFICFVAAWMVYFLASAFAAVDRDAVAGSKGVFANKSVRRNTVLAAIFFAAVVLSWTDFRMFVIVAAFGIAIASIFLRIGGKDLWSAVLITDTVLAVGLILGACYYIPAGLWDTVFSGGFVLGLLTIVLSLAFAAAEKKPWVVTIPAFIVIIAVIAVIFAFGLPEISEAMNSGNSVYSGSLMKSLVSSSSATSISGMAAYYGWLTLWLPLIFGAWMLYKYRKNANSRLYGFTALFLLLMFFAAWFSADYAVAAGAAFAIGCAALTVTVIRAVDLKGYFASLRGNGVRAGARKALNFFPLVTLLVAVFLVAVPNAVYAVDAATPTNDEKSDYFGGLGYTVSTTDDSMIDTLWTDYSGKDKSGALVTWITNSNDAVTEGGFKTVTDVVGGGSSAMTAIYLADSSAKAVAAFIVRVMCSADIDDFKADFSAVDPSGPSSTAFFDNVKSLFTADGAEKYIETESAKFSGIDVADATCENAVYLAVTDYIADTIGEDEIQKLYASVCKTAGHYNGIKYVQVDGSMLPIYYGDSSSFATMAYLGNYTTDYYGAVKEFYSFGYTTGYANYKDAMYQTFLWKALFGIDGSGYDSTTDLLEKLALADRSVSVAPATALGSFDVVYWHVKYNADSDATADSDGWTEMDGYEAVAKQKSEGGLINYLSSVVLLEYNGGNSARGEVSGQITADSDNISGVKVAVFEYNEKLGKYVQRSTAFTNINGMYTVSVPASGDYYIQYSVGASNAFDGTAVKTVYKADIPASGYYSLELDLVDITGSTVIESDGSDYNYDGYIKFTGKSCGRTYQVDVIGGMFSVAGMVPDVYSADLISADGTSVTTADVTFVYSMVNARVSVPSGTVTVSITEPYGGSYTGQVTVYNVSTGMEFEGTAEAGSAKISVPVGTYAVKAVENYSFSSTSTVSVTSGGSKTISLTLFDAKELAITNTTGSVPTISAIGYIGVAESADKAYVPAPGGAVNTYTASVIENGKIYYGSGTYESGIVLVGTDFCTVSGIVKNADGDTVSGATVNFVDGSNVFVYTTDSDGKYTAYLPKDTTFVQYAYNGSSLVSLANITVSADTDKADIAMGTAYSVGQYVNTYTASSGSSKYLAYFGVEGKITVGDAAYTVPVLTNTSGRAVFWVPENSGITITLKAFDSTSDGGILKATEDQTYSKDEVTSNTSNTWTFRLNDTDKLQVAKTLHVTNNTGYPLKVKYKESDEYTDWADAGQIDMYAGKWYVDTEALLALGYHSEESFTLYLGHSSITLDDLSGFVCFTAEVKYNDGDTLNITAFEDASENTGKYVKGEKTVDETTGVATVKYYLEQNFDYTFNVKNSDGAVAVSSIVFADTPTSISVDLTTLYKTVKVSGSVGADISGTMEVEYTYNSESYTFYKDVTDGEYEFEVPENVGTVTMRVNGLVYENDGKIYTFDTDADKTVNVADKDVTCNFSVVTSAAEYDWGDDVYVHYDNVTGSFKSDGSGEMTFTITNNSDFYLTYLIKGSSAFVLDQTYALSIVPGYDGTVTVKGHFDAATVGAGSEDMYVCITDTAGNEVADIIVPADCYERSGDDLGTKVNVTSADGASADIAAGSAYKYAVTFANSNLWAEMASVTAEFVSSSDDWTVCWTDSDGYMVFSGLSNGPFLLKGYSTTTVYVTVINTDGQSTAVPDVKFSISVTDLNGADSALSTDSAGLTVSGKTVSAADLKAQKADLSLDSGSVSDGGASDEGKKIGTTFWVLFVLTVLVLLLIIWTGSKRGVFARR